MAGRELEAIISLAGKLDPSLAASVQQAQAMLGRLDKNLKRSKAVAAIGKSAKAVAVAVGSAAVAGGVFVAKSVQKGMEFDSAMSQVAATLGTTTDQIGDLRKFALEMGSTTKFTATESAEALNYMALAGYDAETSMKMLPNVLNLAAAGNLELAQASDMVTDAQSALGLNIEQTNMLVDQMAKTASKTNTSVGQLGEAILTVGGTAQYMAGGTAGVNAALGVLADNGIKASEGGTHLRNILLKLASPTSEATKLLNDMGVQVFDAGGKLRDFSELFPELNAAMSTMTDEQKLSAMSTLFNARDIASATALLGTTKERWEEIGGALQNCEGAAKAMADTQLDNLEGDVTIFKSALEGAQITLADALTPALREFVQFGTSAIGQLQSAFNENGLSGVVSAAVNIISQMLNALVGALPQIAQVGFQFIAELVMAIVQALPQVMQAAVQIVMILAQGLTQAAPQLIGAIFQAVGMMLVTLASAIPQFFTAALQLISALAQGIIANLPMLVSYGLQAAVQFILGLIRALPQIIQIGIQLVMGLISGLVQALPQIIEAGVQAILMLIEGITQNLPMLITAGIQAVFMLAQGLLSNLGAIISAGVQIVVALGQAIITNLPSIIGQIVTGLGQGIVDGIGAFFGGIGDFFGGLFGGGGEAQAAATEMSAPFESVPADIESSLSSIDASGAFSGLDSSAQTSADGITSAFEGIDDQVLASFDQIPAGFDTSMASLGTSSETTVSQITSSFDQIPLGFDASMASLTASADTTAAQMGTSFDQIPLNFDTAMASLTTSADTTAASVGTSFDQTGLQIQQALGGETVANIQSQWTGLGEFFNSLSLQIVTSFQTAATQIQTIWQTVVTYLVSSWQQITAAFQQGATAAQTTAATIQSSFSGVSATIYEIVNAANQATASLQAMASAAASAQSAASMASAASGAGFAKGGFTSGPALAGEDPHYPREAVISFNPAYRTQNIGYLQTAARMLGVPNYELYDMGSKGRAIDSPDGGLITNMSVESSVNVGDINFNPTITISGNASQDDIIGAIRKVFPEFCDLVQDALGTEAVGSYGFDF